MCTRLPRRRPLSRIIPIENVIYLSRARRRIDNGPCIRVVYLAFFFFFFYSFAYIQQLYNIYIYDKDVRVAVDTYSQKPPVFCFGVFSRNVRAVRQTNK